MQNDGNEKESGGSRRWLLMGLGIACDTSGTPPDTQAVFRVMCLHFILTSIRSESALGKARLEIRY